MNIKIYSKLCRLIPIVVLLLSSCSDFLTVTPDNRTEEEGYYDSPQRVEQAVTGVYTDLRRALLHNYSWLMYGEARAGDLVVDVDYLSYVTAQNLKANQYDLVQLTDWGYFYDVIKSANDVLDIVGKSDDEVLSEYQRNLYKGEALALKSTAYFYLTRIWGDIPSAEAADFGQKITGAAVIERAVAYAAEARGLLPWVLLNNDGIESASLTAIRFNKTAATLLLAQEELWRGKGAEALTALQGLSADGASLSGLGLSLGKDRRTEIPTLPLSAAMVSMPLARLNAIYPEGDQRRAALFTISATQATLIVRDQTMLELLKLSEINLLQAEAAWRSGKLTEARQFLITAAQGATEDYTGLTEQTFADALLLERQRLLVGTGQRFFDLVRFGKVTRFIPALSEAAVQNGAAYWPLSARSISGNSLSQNSYWAN
ncbi:RagB/SusD family nutrient uptake outer membrane protein [Dyadobacter bucti]|uniref:RagB/SusD family nutrient uptake outer membrane protein n=1 Tax=Dyadobacter bucti TaxID=2572203 RepID=UPI001407E561|nr:RagB/SusD family nutrient uptake outer membrane protein [Dyadobacter bucti]